MGLLLAMGTLAWGLDLEGAWRRSPSDDPRWAGPGVDVSSWPVVMLPRTSAPWRGVYWLRRSIAASPNISSPALAIGVVGECYEVYVNGGRIGDNGCRAGERVDYYQPRQYVVPSGLLRPGEPAVIALRVKSVYQQWSIAGDLRDEGPYLLAGIAEASVAAEAGQLRMQRAVLPGALMCFGQFGLALILLTFWVRSRESVAQLLLGLFLLAVSINTSSAVILVFRGGTLPAWWPFLLVVAYFLLAAFSFLVLEKRKPPYQPLLGLALVALMVRYTLGPSYYIVVSFSVPWWLCVKALWSGTSETRGFAAVLLAYMASVLNILASQVIPGWPVPVQIYLGGMQVWFTPLMTTAAAYVLMLFVIRAAAQDRREKLRLSGELAAAAEIQTLLLPSRQAEDVEGVYLPASEVGGDFYQVLEREDGSRVVLVGDVSGKGLKAAMLVSVAIGILRNEKASSPASILSALNRGLYGQTGGGFVTCCCLRLGEQVTAASAGHPTPYADGREAAMPAGLPLGLFAEANYEDTTLPGRALTLVSDGVIEAANATGELFGFDRTREISTKSAHEIAEAARAWGQNDDITVVTVRRIS